MPYITQSKATASQINNSLATAPYVKRPTFAEGVGIQRQETTRTETWMAEQNMRNEYRTPKINQMIEMQNDGTLTEEEMAPFRFQRQTGLGAQDATDWNGLAEYVTNAKGVSIDLSDQNMYDAMAEESRGRQEQLELVGLIPSLIGGAAAYLDPRTAALEMATFFTPATPLRFGASSMATIAKMAFKEGAVNLALEAPLQAGIYHFKNKVGIEYNVDDAVANLLTAFAFGNVVGGSRGTYNITIGNVSVKDAITANRIIIDEMAARVDLDSTDRGILRGFAITQAQLEQLPGKKMNTSVRAAYEDMVPVIAGRAGSSVVARALASIDMDQEVLPGGMLRDPDGFAYSPNRRMAEAVRQSRIIEPVDDAYTRSAIRQELQRDTSKKLSKSQFKKTNKKIEDLEAQREAVKAEPIPGKAKAVQPQRQASIKAIDEEIAALERVLDEDIVGQQAISDLRQLERGEVPERLIDQIMTDTSRRPLSFEEQAQLEDLNFMQGVFNMQRDDQAVAAKVYNALASREADRILDQQFIGPRLPTEAAPQVSADVTAARSMGPSYDTDLENYVPAGDPGTNTLIIDADGTARELTLGEETARINTVYADDVSNLKNTVECVRGG